MKVASLESCFPTFLFFPKLFCPVMTDSTQAFPFFYLFVYLFVFTEEKFITDENIVKACEATEEDLLVVHTKRYLNRLKVVFSQHCQPYIYVAA